MWKFLSGVSKPESKWKVDTRESNKAYNATKRKRTFLMTEIMRVKIHSPSVKEFDPLSAIHLWNSS